ncbi:MAG: hypothetical protein ACKVQQ_05085 [Burkholderiales bacterium]
MKILLSACLILAAALAASVSRADDTWLPPVSESVARADDLYGGGAYAQAYAEYFAAAIRGHARAQEVIGMMLLLGPEMYGPDIERNRESALRWLEEAARAGRDVSWHVALAIKQRDAAAGLATAPLDTSRRH